MRQRLTWDWNGGVWGPGGGQGGGGGLEGELRGSMKGKVLGNDDGMHRVLFISS